MTYCSNVYAIGICNVDIKKRVSKLHCTTKLRIHYNYYTMCVCNAVSILTKLILYCKQKLRIDNNHHHTAQFCNIVIKEV